MTTPLTNARLQWDEQGLPRSLDYGDIYYSKADALGESTHVFLHGNELPSRFVAAGLMQFIIGELGFGAGLNFLNTCQLWCKSAPPAATLHYVACELHPFQHADLARLLAGIPSLQPFSAALLAAYPDHTPGVHQLVLRFGTHRVQLTLLYGDAICMLKELIGTAADFRVDAWFLDGFSPKVNPALWQLPLLQLLQRCSHRGTTLSSYSVAGSLRAALTAAGFRVEKKAGFAGKRHMLCARMSSTEQAIPLCTTAGHACVIGGGLAGCSTAYALAESGWQVSLLEQNAALANSGSGNLQAVLHCKPGTAHTADNDFNLHAYLHAARHYDGLQLEGLPWHRCGMLHVGTDAAQLRRFERLHQSGRFSAAIMQPVNAATASALAGIPLEHDSLYFPLSGWLTPAVLCRHYTTHPRIRVLTSTSALAVESAPQGWRITCGDDQQLTTDIVVLCNAGDLFTFTQCRHLPLICNRGQVDVYESSSRSAVRTILCGQGYLTPATDGRQSLGGSYYVEATSSEQNRKLHLQLLQRMDTGLAAELSTRQPLQQRIGQRCQTPDRMPLVGALDSGLPGLYLNVAHGSNGLARTPISAALLASLINGTPPPLPINLRALLNPLRFSRMR